MNTAGSLSALISERARDPNFTGTAQASVINLMSFVQQVVNGVINDSVLTTPLALTPRQNIYKLSTVLPGVVKVLAVQDNTGRDLEPLGPFESLSWVDRHWPVAVSDSPRSWAMGGRDLLIFHPGVNRPYAVQVVYTQLTPALVANGDTTVVTNEADRAITSLTEMLVLIKGRDLTPLQGALERFTKTVTRLNEQAR